MREGKGKEVEIRALRRMRGWSSGSCWCGEAAHSRSQFIHSSGGLLDSVAVGSEGCR